MSSLEVKGIDLRYLLTPRATEHRIFTRVRALHDEVAEMSLRGWHDGVQPDFPAA